MKDIDFSDTKPSKEEKVHDVNARGQTTVDACRITNFTFSFGCSPGMGVGAATKYAQNFIELFTASFHITEGSIVIPASFSQVISSDANFESITSDMAQELRLFR